MFPLQVGKRTIINKLFFDLAQEEEGILDAEFLKVPRMYLMLLNPQPSESSFCPHPGRVPRVGGGFPEGRLYREFKAEARRTEHKGS